MNLQRLEGSEIMRFSCFNMRGKGWRSIKNESHRIVEMPNMASPQKIYYPGEGRILSRHDQNCLFL